MWNKLFTAQELARDSSLPFTQFSRGASMLDGNITQLVFMYAGTMENELCDMIKMLALAMCVHATSMSSLLSMCSSKCTVIPRSR